MATVGSVARIACRLARKDPDVQDDFNIACDYVVEAQRFVCGRDDPWDFLQMSGQFTTVSGADLYPFPELAKAFKITGIKRVLAIADDQDGSGLLQPMHWITLERETGSTQHGGSSDKPISWAQVGAQGIRLWPTPSGEWLLGCLIETLVGDMESSATMVIPDAYASAVCATWAAARMWEEHAGSEARLMADRLDRRHTDAVTNMVRSNGVVRWPFLNFMESDFASHPGLMIGSGSYGATSG
jgi:hypothetical protein